MPNRPALFLLADRILDTDLEKFLRERREVKPPVAWERIARELAQRTENAVDVRGVTIQDWYERYVDPLREAG